MPNSIEIFENTLLQLITRQGTDNDRTDVVLKSGELGYTTDTKRLFIGDGSTYGGNVVGNKFRGNTTNLTTLGSGLIGDIAYKIDENSIYEITTGDGTTVTDWQKIGGVYTAADGSIQITTDNKISVLSLSAGTISNDLMGQSITLNSTNRLTLSSTIATNSIVTQQNTQYLKLPQYLSINSNEYTFPIGELGNNKYLKTDAVGRLSWSGLGSNVNYFTYNSGGILPVGTIISTLTSTNLNTDWVICNGQSLAGVNYQELSAVIGTTYGGNNVNFNVPNLNNRLLYGTSSTPFNSTVYTFTSATTAAALSAHRSSLSAVGVNFFIKATPDKVIKGTFRVESPLNVTVNGTNRNNTNIPALTTLDSNVVVSLPPSQVNINYPLGVTKGGTDVTGTDVSIFDGTLNITGPTNTLQVDSPLKLTVAGTNQTGNPISPYAGNLNLQLNTANTIKSGAPLTFTVNGVDKSGELVALDTPNQNISIDLNLSNLMNIVYPIGSVLFSIDSINPQSRFGGTWTRIANGRFIVGAGTGDDGIQTKEFNTGNNTGEYEHPLTTTEMPNHTHSLAVDGEQFYITNDGNSSGPTTFGRFRADGPGSNKDGRYCSELPSTGDGQAHNNTPPGFGLYVWQRTALA
jgi:microcystin-dependent protein